MQNNFIQIKEAAASHKSQIEAKCCSTVYQMCQNYAASYPRLSVAEHSRRFYCLFELLSDVFVLRPGHQAPYYVGSEQAQVLNIGIRVTAEPSGNEVKTSGNEIFI